MSASTVTGDSLKGQIGQVLKNHELGEALYAEHEGEIHIFLKSTGQDLPTHLAASELQALTGKPVHIRRFDEMSPAEQAVALQKSTKV